MSEDNCEVTLDTVDIDDRELQTFMEDHDISFEIVNFEGPGSGCPEVKYNGGRDALESLIANFFDDEDLAELIEEV